MTSASRMHIMSIVSLLLTHITILTSSILFHYSFATRHRSNRESRDIQC